jgi:error-prone DNA polymerase
MAMTVAGFTGGEAEELRRAMGFKRSQKRMAAIEERLRAGMAKNGIAGETQDAIVRSIASFALYGFPESHAASFALIAYASAHLRAYHPAAFVSSLLNNQPMGFYHPFTLVKDAQRHGVTFLPVDVTKSGWSCALEGDAVRLGLRYVAGLRKEAGERIAALAPFTSLQDFVDRTGLRKDELRRLAEVGALNAFGLTRRSALWQAERAARPRGPLLRDAEAEAENSLATAEEPSPDSPPLPPSAAPPSTPRSPLPPSSESPLPDMTFPERLSTDLLGTGLTIGPHPMILHREALAARGVRRAAELPSLPDGTRVVVAGAVTCRQRPGTAKGFLFLTLEDETGLANVTVRPDLFAKRKQVLVESGALEIEGILQNEEGTSVRALEARPLLTGPVPESRDFH